MNAHARIVEDVQRFRAGHRDGAPEPGPDGRLSRWHYRAQAAEAIDEIRRIARTNPPALLEFSIGAEWEAIRLRHLDELRRLRRLHTLSIREGRR